jgi:hypothetical protein
MVSWQRVNLVWLKSIHIGSTCPPPPSPTKEVISAIEFLLASAQIYFKDAYHGLIRLIYCSDISLAGMGGSRVRSKVQGFEVCLFRWQKVWSSRFDLPKKTFLRSRFEVWHGRKYLVRFRFKVHWKGAKIHRPLNLNNVNSKRSFFSSQVTEIRTQSINSALQSFMFMARGRSGNSRMFRFKVWGSRSQGTQVLAAKGPRFNVRPFRKKK